MSGIFKLIRWVLILAVLAAAAFVAVNWQTVQQIARFSPIVLPHMGGEAATEAEARAQDVAYLRKLVKYDRSYSKAAKEEFSRLLGELEKNSATMSEADLYVGASKAAALADNGHTGVSIGPLYRNFNTIAAKLYWFADGLYVVRADEEFASIVGARVVAIDETPTSDVLANLTHYVGGAPQWRKLHTPFMIESPEIMHAIGVARSPDEITFSVVSADGVARSVVFQGARSEGQASLPTRRAWVSLKPVPLPGEGGDWTLALSANDETAPLYLRDSDKEFYAAPMSGDGFYIRTQTSADTPETPIEMFYDETLSGIADGSLDYLVVDLRFNPGGDYTKSLNFAKTAPQKIRDGGRLYIVVGPQTFSAAIVTAALLKYNGGEKSMLVGAPMGDREQFWAERGMPFTLPHSKFNINYATGYHDWEHGCEGHPYCFTQNLIHGVAAGSLAPLVAFDPTYADYASGRDIVIDWIAEQEENRPEQSASRAAVDDLAGQWRLTFNVKKYGELDTVVTFDGDVAITGSSVSAAPGEFAGIFDGPQDQSVKMDLRQDFTGGLIGRLDSVFGEANIKISLNDGTLSGQLDGELNGTVTGAPFDGELPLRDYGAVLASVDALTEAWLYDLRFTETDQWSEFHSKLEAATAAARDDFDMVAGFKRSWGEGLFSHYELLRHTANLQQLVQEADARADDKPVARVEFTEDDIAIITIDTFFGERIAEQIDAAFREAIERDARALIIDLRENGGGTLAAWPVAARLVQRADIAGYFISNRWWKDHEALPTTEFLEGSSSPAEVTPQAFQQDLFSDGVLVMRVVPHEVAYKGPVQVLISKKSRSATEALVGVLQYLGRVSVVGENSAGYMLNSNFFPAAEGFALRIPVADFFLPNHQSLEAVGVAPDVPTDPADTLNVALERARSE